ncbi:MAG TPA: hypothetical protein VGS06_02385 [Streptosporangiaceae bacterium]|nr:hypothetical protein [Streptosporangiaceae bacterium]
MQTSRSRTAVISRRQVVPRLPLTALVWAVAAVSLAGFAAAWILAGHNHDLFHVTADSGPDRFLIAYPVVGAVLASRRRSNPIGWLLLGIGLVAAARGLAGEYALDTLAGPGRPETGVWAAWFTDWSLTLVFPTGLLLFVLLLFPDGRPLTARWSMLGWLAAGLGLVYLLVTWLDPDAISVTGLPSVPNPTGVRGLGHISRQGSLGQGIWIAGFGCLLLAAASVVVRYRRSAGEERLQLKWFAYAVAVNLVLLAVSTPLSASDGGAWQVAFSLAVVVGVGLALPVAIGVAVLKYRLYAIHRIISRSVSYAVVTGLVVGVYLGCVALLTDVLPFRGTVGVAVAVLVAAALFNPLRRRVQALVDRRFDRARYDAERVIAQFSVRLREQVDLDVLGADLLGVVHHVLAPEHLALWLNDSVEPAAATDGPGSDQVPEARL